MAHPDGPGPLFAGHDPGPRNGLGGDDSRADAELFEIGQRLGHKRAIRLIPQMGVKWCQGQDVDHYKDQYDIFICGGTQHFARLKTLLPQLYPFGRLHLASITLSAPEAAALSPYYDALHQPRHHPDGYLNFNLFCIREINNLARAPRFIKLDADVSLRDDWIEYVERAAREHAEAVLFGIKEGLAKVDVGLAGPLVRQMLGRDLRVANGRKVIGGFYVGETAFFQRHDRFMQIVHDLLYCFREGRRCRPSPRPDLWPAEEESGVAALTLTGHFRDLQRIGNEDTLRSLVVHAAGASDRLLVLDSQGKILVPHGPDLPSCSPWFSSGGE